mgnify:CR=1 FL=1
MAFQRQEDVQRRLIDLLEPVTPKPRCCIIGEPTSMQVIRAHKGKMSMRCHVSGHECHSGLSHLGVNAVEAAVQVGDPAAARPLVEGTVPRGHLREDDAFYRGLDADGNFVARMPVEVDQAMARSADGSGYSVAVIKRLPRPVRLLWADVLNRALHEVEANITDLDRWRCLMALPKLAAWGAYGHGTKLGTFALTKPLHPSIKVMSSLLRDTALNRNSFTRRFELLPTEVVHKTLNRRNTNIIHKVERPVFPQQLSE